MASKNGAREGDGDSSLIVDAASIIVLILLWTPASHDGYYSCAASNGLKRNKNDHVENASSSLIVCSAVLAYASSRFAVSPLWSTFFFRNDSISSVQTKERRVFHFTEKLYAILLVVPNVARTTTISLTIRKRRGNSRVDGREELIR